LNFTRSEAVGPFSVLQVVFLLQRHTGYFLIQVYLPCALIVVLSWVGFWLNREATSDRVTLGVTAVLTLSAISMDSRSDLPKVHYATALDWFIICSFLYCMASILEFAGVHYFTKVGYGETFGQNEIEDEEEEYLDDGYSGEDLEDENEWEDLEEWKKFRTPISVSNRWSSLPRCPPVPPPIHLANNINHRPLSGRSCEIAAYNHLYGVKSASSTSSTDSLPAKTFMGNHHGLYRPVGLNENPRCKQTCLSLKHQIQKSSDNASLRCPQHQSVILPQTGFEDNLDLSEEKSNLKNSSTKKREQKLSIFHQFVLCFLANEDFRKKREKAATLAGTSFNSVSKIDNFARLLFPLTFLLFNLLYWSHYAGKIGRFDWEDHHITGNIQ